MVIKKPSTFRILTTLIILAAVIVSIPVLNGPIHETHAATTRTISLVGTINAWNFSTINPNPTITVSQGDTLTIKLTSTDTFHLFFVDVDRNGVSPDCPPGPDPCSTAFSTTSPTTFTFQASFAPGTYVYYCSVHPATMFGSFIVQGPDYTVSANPSSLSIGQGLSPTSTITVTSAGGFTGTVGLTAKVSPPGPTVSLSPMSVTLTSGASQTSQLTIATTSTTPLGAYTVTVNATSGSTLHTATITVTVTNGGPVGAAPTPVDKLTIILPYAVAVVLLLAVTATVLVIRRRAR
jgi:plastocyanin